MNVSKRLRLNLIRLREPLVGYITGLSFVLFLLFFRLGSLVNGLSTSEARTLEQSRSLRQLIENPLNLPYKLVEFGLIKWHHASAFGLRSISVVFTLIIVCLFYYTLRSWYARRTAILGTTLFATSSWLMHYARLAQPDILYISIIAVLAYGTWLRQTKKSGLAIIIGGLLAVFLVYIPGFIWFVLLGGLWQRKMIFKHYKLRTMTGFLSIFMSCALLVPLIYGLALYPGQIRQLLGLQLVGLPNFLDILHRIIKIPYLLFVRADYSPVTWLGHLPLLDILVIVMLLLGLYAYYFLRELDRSRAMLGISLVSVILIGLHGGVSMLILMPIIYILVAAGIALLIQQWLTVFPRNPLAGAIGTVMISLSVMLAVYYNVNHYFIAWPNNPDTKKAFIIRSPQ